MTFVYYKGFHFNISQIESFTTAFYYDETIKKIIRVLEITMISGKKHEFYDGEDFEFFDKIQKALREEQEFTIQEKIREREVQKAKDE